MAVKTTKIQCNQDVDLRGKVDIEGKVTCGSNVDVDGTLTINSAKDLKTKDGTSLGSNVQRIDITTILSQEDILSLIVALTEHLENPSFTFDFTFTNNINNPTAHEINLYLDMTPFGKTGFIDLFFIRSSKQDGIRYASTYTSYAGKLIRCGSMALTGSNNILTTIYGGGIACADYALKTELNAKQATLYCHTVTFSEGGLGLHNRFTAYSEKSTPIYSIQDLIAVFGNTELQCSGTINRGVEPCIGIDIGTDADTTFFINITGLTQKLSDWYSTSPEATLTIIDNVTAM